jgi:hypothetical protein
VLDEELERLLGWLLGVQQSSATIKQKNQWWYWWRKQEDQENEQMEQQRMWPELGWLQSELEQLQPEWESALVKGWVPAQWMLLEVLQLGMSGNLDPNWRKKWSKSGTSVVNSSADKFTNIQYVKQCHTAIHLTYLIRADLLGDNLGVIVMGHCREGSSLGLFLDNSLSKFVEFPASFSTTFKLKVSCALLLSQPHSSNVQIQVQGS